MKPMSRRIARLVLAFALAAVAPVALVISAGCGKKSATAVAATKYQCPMHPQIIRDKPGECPICGMTLVPIEDGSPATAAVTKPLGTERLGPDGLATVTLDARKQSLLGLKTVAVTRALFETSIRTTGRVAPDERRVHHVHTRYEGFV
ncbi:MAG: heavy metal-binding domain-containing protein, partial [Thermoanaerobaculia bacterium]